MPKVSVVTPEKANEVSLPHGIECTGQAKAYLGARQFPLQLFQCEIFAGGALAIAPQPADCVVYVWSGVVEAGGQALPVGSSMIVERGAEAAISATDAARLLIFAASGPPESVSAGGHVHLLPADRAPRSDDLGQSGVGGAMHADSDCPTCDVWLHENWFPGGAAPDEETVKRGIHSHSEDEIIFVLGGSMRLGNKLVGPGTALAIAADTLYSFTPGPDGLHFVNFRAAMPGDIRFTNGPSISETGYWREKLPRPEYLEPA